MLHLLQKYAANGFADFSGLSISGKIPVKQELINEVIAELLATLKAEPASPQSQSAGIDSRVFLPFVKRVEVNAESGKLTVHFDVRVE